MFMTKKITFIFKNKVADMVIILCVERLQAQSSCSKSDFFWLLSWHVHGWPFIQVWQYLFFFKVSVWAPPEQIDQGQFALDVAVEVLEYYEQKFKVDYPLPKQGTCWFTFVLFVSFKHPICM